MNQIPPSPRSTQKPKQSDSAAKKMIFGQVVLIKNETGIIGYCLSRHEIKTKRISLLHSVPSPLEKRYPLMLKLP